MGFHSFSLDPRTVLGVGPSATLEEIHTAYRAKSKKHHPDVGGDEWAFRMVTRAYEVLKTTVATAETRPWEAPGPAAPERPGGPWSWTSGPWATQPGAGAGARASASTSASATAEADEAASGESAAAGSNGAANGTGLAGLDPARIRTVDVELIWTRFEKDGPARLLAERDADDSTLSVYMVISWPEAGLVNRVTEYPGAAETLRALIDLFERLREQKDLVGSRSRIEDGRFVGWLSYPDVLSAQDAVLAVRDAFRASGLAIKLQTRDERIPFDWHAEVNAPVMSQAS